MSKPESHPAALPLARLCREIRRAAALSRTRTNGSFDAMLSELESNADGFADTLSAIAEEFGLTLEDEGSFHSELEEAREAQEEEGGPPRGVAAELQA